jgi:hypothetical protein
MQQQQQQQQQQQRPTVHISRRGSINISMQPAHQQTLDQQVVGMNGSQNKEGKMRPVNNDWRSGDTTPNQQMSGGGQMRNEYVSLTPNQNVSTKLRDPTSPFSTKNTTSEDYANQQQQQQQQATRYAPPATPPATYEQVNVVRSSPTSSAHSPFNGTNSPHRILLQQQEERRQTRSPQHHLQQSNYWKEALQSVQSNSPSQAPPSPFQYPLNPVSSSSTYPPSSSFYKIRMASNVQPPPPQTMSTLSTGATNHYITLLEQENQSLNERSLNLEKRISFLENEETKLRNIISENEKLNCKKLYDTKIMMEDELFNTQKELVLMKTKLNDEVNKRTPILNDMENLKLQISTMKNERIDVGREIQKMKNDNEKLVVQIMNKDQIMLKERAEMSQLRRENQQLLNIKNEYIGKLLTQVIFGQQCD